MYTSKKQVSFSQIDKNGCISVANTVNVLQDTLMEYNSSLGTSPLEMLEYDRAWMVSSWHVVFKRRPKFDELFGVDSWVYRINSLFASWNFEMYTEDSANKKEVLAYADAKWFLAEPSTGKPARVTEKEKGIYEIESAYDMDYSSRKILYPENMQLAYTVPVSPNFLDTNHHVNNGVYIRLAANLIPENFVVNELRAQYQAAAHLGDTFYIRTKDENDIFYVALTDADENPYFVCEFK